MLSSKDVRDRTAEFFSTVDALTSQRTNHASPTNTVPSSSTGHTTGQPGTTAGPFSGLAMENRNHGHANGGFGQMVTPIGDDVLRPEHLRHGGSRMQQASQFAQATSHISKGIVLVSEKLEQLTKLAKQKSLFQDSSDAINRLTYVIKTDLQTLNGEIDVVADFVAAQGGMASRQSQANSNRIVDSLKTELATKTKSFAEILQTRTTVCW